MAAFDGDGFAAVDAFFGKTSTTPTSRKSEVKAAAARSEQLLQAQAQTQQGPKRLGLGADVSLREDKSANAVSASNPLTKRLLQVGTKGKLSQKRDADDYDDDNDDEEADKNNDEDGDEEGGRTAIEERVPTVVPVSAAILAKEAAEVKAASKKKKKGKKERQKEGADAAEAVPKDESREATEGAEDHEAPSQKRKRTKIRSRQKNIYKDKRSEKPSHLIPGKHNYQGRPMTLETRKRLNLPLEKPASTEETWSSNWNDDQAKDTAVDTMPLAVDAVTEQPSEEKKPKKKAKKSRFKNLR
jgi:hypothetical protein